MKNIFPVIILLFLTISALIIGCNHKGIDKGIDKDIGIGKWQSTVRTFGGAGYDIGTSCAVCSDGNILIVGYTNSQDKDLADKLFPNSNYYTAKKFRKEDITIKIATDLWVLKVDPKNGQILYNRCFGGSGDDAGYSITETADGNILVLGDTNSTDGDLLDIPRESYYNLWLLKIDPKEDKIIYNKRIGGMPFENLVIHANSIIETSDGNIAITAQVNTKNMETYGRRNEPEDFNKTGFGIRTENNDIWVLKVDPRNDKILYNEYLGGSGDDGGVAIMESEDGNLVVVGNTSSQSGKVTYPSKYGGKDIWVLKIDPNDKKILYNKCFGGSYNDLATSAVKCRDGSILISAYTGSVDGHLSKRKKALKGVLRENAKYGNWVLKINIEKDMILYNEFFKDTDERVAVVGVSVVETKDGCIFLAEKTEIEDKTHGWRTEVKESLRVREINLKSGKIFYESLFDDVNAEAITETKDGRIVVVGSSVEKKEYPDLWCLTVAPILEEFNPPKK